MKQQHHDYLMGKLRLINKIAVSAPYEKDEAVQKEIDKQVHTLLGNLEAMLLLGAITRREYLRLTTLTQTAARSTVVEQLIELPEER